MKKGSDGYYRETFTYEGKRYSVRAKTQRDLWRKVDEKRSVLESGMVVTNEKTPVKKWFSDYLETYKRSTVTPRTYDQLLSYCKNYIFPAIGDRRIKDVRPIDLQRILNTCAGQSASHANKLRNLIRGAFRQARIDRVIIYDPAESLTMPETTSGTHRSVTDDERRYILATCEHHRAGLWVLFMLYTGARPDETRKALWADIDFLSGVVTLHSSKTNYGDRRVPLAPALKSRLLAARQESGYLFTQPTTGSPHTKTSMRQMWESFRRALAIEMGAQTYRGALVTNPVADDLTPYCLRHTYATDLQTAGVPINVAKDLLGHATIAMTSQIYTHLSDAAFASAAERIVALDDARRQNKLASIK